ncbi:MAG TPA: SRPBCC domain-containing protein [Patescibacteria group bacterium]|nr:SRPBCC domain-containing protein [Patescibacteria group bacterium]
MSKTDFVVDKQKLEVRITRLFNASPERMWQAHTTPDDIVQWWVGTKVDKLELKVGGAWRFVSEGEDGKVHAFRGEFKELDEPNKIVRTFEYEPVPGHIMVESVMFEPQTDGKTKQVTISKFKNLEDLNGMVGMGMEHGAEDGLNRLAKVVESN